MCCEYLSTKVACLYVSGDGSSNVACDDFSQFFCNTLCRVCFHQSDYYYYFGESFQFGA